MRSPQSSDLPYLVTGGGAGIGRATVHRLLQNGASVIAADIGLDAAKETVNSSPAPANVWPVELDVTRRSMWEDVANWAASEFGGLRGLVNNAGITRDRTLGKMSDREWQDVIDVHLYGSWLGSQVCFELLKSADSSAIVMVTSSGRHGSFGQTNYAAAKAGLVGLAKTLSLEGARHGIRCNCVEPGAVNTQMTDDVPPKVKSEWLDSIPLGRFAEPDEIAEAIAFLLSDASSYITGHVLSVTGGEAHH